MSCPLLAPSNPLLLPPPGGSPEGLASAHERVMAALDLAGPYRFTLLDGPLGSRDAVRSVSDVAYRLLREVDEGTGITLVASFREAAGDAALFDGQVWGQGQGLTELDRLRYPQVPGGVDMMSLAGRVARVTAFRAEGEGVPLDTFVLRFDAAPAALRDASPAP